MKSKSTILLFHPRTYHEKNYRYYHVPYSLLAISSSLDLEKYNIVIIDNNVHKRTDYTKLLSKLKDDLLCVGISCMVGAQIRDALNFARQVKEVSRDIPVIVGGPLPTMLPQLTILHPLFDIAVRGQGELTFLELIDSLENQVSLDNIKGISYKTNGEIKHNTERPFVDLNKFPPYSKVYELIDVEEYVWYDEHIASRTVSYHSSQGCPYACGFCCEVPLWKRWWSGLSASRVLYDIEYLVKKYRVNGIKFYDSEFFIDINRAIDITKGLLEKGISIKWGASIHPRNFMRIKNWQLKLFVESGLKRLLIGVESAVQSELDLINKNITPNTIMKAAERCSEYGIIGCFTFVIGYPEMPEKNFFESLNFAEKLADKFPDQEIKLHLYAPYPGTPLYPLAVKHGFKPPVTLEEWADYDYYGVTTPWAKPEWAQLIREFNEKYYPYIKNRRWSNGA